MSLFVHLAKYLMVLNSAASHYCLVSGKMIHYLLLFSLVTLAKDLGICILPLSPVSHWLQTAFRVGGPDFPGISGKVASGV